MPAPGFRRNPRRATLRRPPRGGARAGLLQQQPWQLQPLRVRGGESGGRILIQFSDLTALRRAEELRAGTIGFKRDGDQIDLAEARRLQKRVLTVI